ncbi:alpha/beta hydrolase [Caldicellulosiruptor morganii]|uniref:Alpha/beta hydrolase n=1 Tax=Caldicellulosiruptor morganii TaxID=1387555 RepID=A0ABY7BP28_9FIRM|nr:alpha/beta hydrolase [Caldicellulosiruptor morganii]WAM34280.1 alpha/beta hydrolase [Caldicellulosiruptor morganii]
MIPLWQDNIPLYDDQHAFVPYLEPYLIENGTQNPCIIVFPGGGYTHRAEHEAIPVAKWLNSIGISAFVLHYRVSPYRYPAASFDAKRAVRLVRYSAKSFNIDPKRIGVLGFSAGGHLASIVGTLFDEGDRKNPDPVERVSCRPDCMVLCYPVISMAEFAHEGSRKALLGQSPDPALIWTLSTHNMVTGSTPPTFLWHTADDGSVRVENSLLFAMALSKHNVPFELHIFPHGKHGLGLARGIPFVEKWTELCEKWLENIGFIKKPN